MPRIEQMMILSTAHLSETTARHVDDSLRGDGPIPISGAAREYGFLIFADQDATKNRDVPGDLRTALLYALKHDCEWVLFDRDEDPVDALPLYEW